MGAMKNLSIVAAEEGFREVPAMEYAVVVDGRIVDAWETFDAAMADAEKIAGTVVEVVPFIQFAPVLVSGPEGCESGIS